VDQVQSQVQTIIDHPHRFERQVESFIETATALGSDYALRLIGALVILSLGWFAATLVNHAMVRVARRSPHVDLTIATFAGSAAKYIILGFAVLATLANFGVQTTSFIAIIGAAGIAVGLAMQGTLGHVASGFMIILFRPFRVGDYVETAGSAAGTVTGISLFTTELVSADNLRIILPNSLVWSAATRNMSMYGMRRTEVEVGISYDEDVAAALRLAQEAVAAESRVLKEPAPVVGISKFADLGAKLLLQVWVPVTNGRTSAGDVQAVQLALNQAIYARLRGAGITMGRPTHVDRLPPSAG
jgi:small conductance mechanosensitive channel